MADLADKSDLGYESHHSQGRFYERYKDTAKLLWEWVASSVSILFDSQIVPANT